MSYEKWVEITTIGSKHELELEIYSNKRRYRPFEIHLDKSSEELDHGEWIPGIPQGISA